MTFARPRILLPAATGLFLVLLLAPSAIAQGAMTLSFSPSQPKAGETITYSAQTEQEVQAWAWDFGDGATSVQARPEHAYARGGTYEVRLSARLADGSSQTANASLTIAEPAFDQAGTQSDYPRWLYWTMPLVVGFIQLSIAFIVLVKGQPIIYNRVFFMLYAASAVKGFTEFIFFLTYFTFGESHSFILPVLTLNRAIGFLYPHFFLWFVLVFPRPLRPWLKNGWRGSLVLLFALPFFLLESLLQPGSIVGRNLFNAYVSLLALVALGLLVYHAWETDSAEERYRIRLLAATFFLLVFSTIVVTLLQFLAAGSQGPAAARYESLALASGLIFVPVVELLGCILLMYAILRYQLLGVGLFLRRVTRATAFAIVIGFIFIVVSNSVEQLFQVKFLAGIPLDFLLAGFLSAIMMYPVQKGTEKLANRLFPQAASRAPDHLSERRMEIYEAQLRYALLDGMLKEKELAMLNALRDSLGLRTDELKRVVQRFPGVNPGVLLTGATPLRAL